MEENIKNLTKSMIYYGLAVGNESLELVIRKFYYNKGKSWADELINAMPENHITRKYYNKVSGENFDNVQSTAFVKMAMWEIKEQVDNWEFIASEEHVDKFVEDICQINVDNIKQFIKENEGLLNENLEKYGFYFAILYIYLTNKKENANNIEYLKKIVNLIERSKFGSLFGNDDEIAEKYKYLLTAYDDLVWELDESKQYDLAEEYYNKYIDFLKRYLESHSNSYEAKSYLSNAYSSYAYILWNIAGGINNKSDDLTYKAIEIRKKLLEEYPNKKSYLLGRLAVNYNNMAYEYKKAYKKENNEEYKTKYYDLYRKSINYREKLGKLGEFKNIDEKIKNYNELGKMYYFLFEDDKARENYNIALEICKKEGNSNEKWIEVINKGLSNLKGE